MQKIDCQICTLYCMISIMCKNAVFHAERISHKGMIDGGEPVNNVILHVPEWQGEFVYSKEVLIFALTILLVLVGLLLCFKGYRYFQTICFMGIAGAMLYIGYLLVEKMTGNKVLQLLLSVTFAFFGVCIAYFVFILADYILGKLRFKQKMLKVSFLFTAFLGGAVLSATIYFGIYQDALTAAIAGGVLALAGGFFQHKNQKKQIKYKTYNDIMAMKRPGAQGQEVAAEESSLSC